METILEGNSMSSTSHHDSSLAAARLAQEKRRTKMLLYLLAFCTAVLLGKHTTDLQEVALDTGLSARTTSRYLPESKHGKALPNEDEAVDSSSLFVPSLDYRINGISQYNHDVNFEAHVYCPKIAKDLKWEWWQQGEKPEKSKSSHLKGSDPTKDSILNSTSKRLMIGLHAGYDDYAKLLEQSVWSARVYGQTWGSNVTVVTLQGTSFAPHGCQAPRSHSTLNKIRLLFYAIDHNDEYDQVLLLDSDAFVYDMNVDITTLLDEKQHMIGAQSLPGTPQGNSWNIHSGVTLWNLHHPRIASVAIDWFERAKTAVVKGVYTNDQEFLQSTLKEYVDWQDRQTEKSQSIHDGHLVLNFQNHEFGFADGTVVKQFVKKNVTTDDNEETGSNIHLDADDITGRLDKMFDAVQDVCENHVNECASVIQPQYETS